MSRQRDPQDSFTAVKENDKILGNLIKTMVNGVIHDSEIEGRLRHFINGQLEVNLMALLECLSDTRPDRAVYLLQQSRLIEKMRKLCCLYYTVVDHGDAAVIHLNRIHSAAVSNLTSAIETRAFKPDDWELFYKTYDAFFKAVHTACNKYYSVIGDGKKKR